MKKMILLGCLMLGSIGNIIAQISYIKGRIITQKGDTLQGLIRETGIKKFDNVEFTEAGGTSNVSYLPGQIKGFWLENRTFFLPLHELIEKQKIAELPENSFVEVLVRGYITLINYKGRFFIYKKGEALQELKVERVEKIINGKKHVKTIHKYRGLLQYQMRDCPDIAAKVNKVGLTHEQLTTLIEAYHACTTTELDTYYKKKDVIRLEAGGYGGVLSSKFNFNVLDHSHSPTLDFSRSNNTTFGLTTNLYLPRLVSERLSLQADVHFHKTSYSAYYENTESGNYRYDNYDFAFETLRIPIGVGYNFNVYSTTIRLSGGVLNVWNRNTSTRQEHQSFANGSAWDEIKDPFQFSSNRRVLLDINTGLWGGLTFQRSLYKRLNYFMELRYEHVSRMVERRVTGIMEPSIANQYLLVGLKIH